MAKDDSKLNEKILCDIWKNKVLQKEFKTFNDESIIIINSGTENTDTAGPDFNNAKVRIGNFVFVGDIEIDVDYNDWKSHGHYLDKRYNKVIVHASLINKNQSSYVYNKDGRKIPSICLEEYLKENYGDEYKEEIDNVSNRDIHYLRCKDVNASLDQKIKKAFLKKLGMDRFQKKKEKIFYRLKELVFLNELNIREPVIKYELNQDFLNKEFTANDFKIRELWQQLFYEFIFEALGYSKNKSPMLHLAQYANIEIIKNISESDNQDLLIHSVLFNIAGLIAENQNGFEKEEYLKNISVFWEKYKTKYDGKILSKTDWHFFKLRPNNFPTIRIAGGAALVKKIVFEGLIDNVISRFERIRNQITLAKAVKSLFIIPADGFWKYHYTLDEVKNIKLNYFIGSSRADEIIINVVLPFISIYGDIFDNVVLKKNVQDIYYQYIQNEDNSIAKFMSESLAINNAWKKSILSQGMLELFRSYCSKNKCLECNIGKIVFN
jgi:hypothetical protein